MGNQNVVDLHTKVLENFTQELLGIHESLSGISEGFANAEKSKEYIDSQIKTVLSNIDMLQSKVHNVSTRLAEHVESMNFKNEQVKILIGDRLKSLEERLEGFKERLEGNRQDLQGIRERDLTALARQSNVLEIQMNLQSIENRVNELPTLEIIKSDLLSDANGLATLKKLSETENEVHFIKGMLTVNMVTTFATFATMLFVGINTFKGFVGEKPEMSSNSNDIFRSFQVK